VTPALQLPTPTGPSVSTAAGVAPAWRWAIFGASAAVAAWIAWRWAFDRGSGPIRRLIGLFLLILVAAWVVGPGGVLATTIIPQAVQSWFAKIGRAPAGAQGG
jgi:hypothetical protein